MSAHHYSFDLIACKLNGSVKVSLQFTKCWFVFCECDVGAREQCRREGERERERLKGVDTITLVLNSCGNCIYSSN